MTDPILGDPILDSDAELDAFITAFRDGTFPIAKWHHRQHIIMAAWHLLRYSETEATDLIRNGIRKYNAAQGGQNTGTSGYHETLTIFWIRLAAHALAGLPDEMSDRDRILRVADGFGKQTKLFTEYYSFDVVRSTPARLAWIEPDLKALP